MLTFSYYQCLFTFYLKKIPTQSWYFMFLLLCIYGSTYCYAPRYCSYYISWGWYLVPFSRVTGESLPIILGCTTALVSIKNPKPYSRTKISSSISTKIWTGYLSGGVSQYPWLLHDVMSRAHPAWPLVASFPPYYNSGLLTFLPYLYWFFFNAYNLFCITCQQRPLFPMSPISLFPTYPIKAHMAQCPARSFPSRL